MNNYELKAEYAYYLRYKLLMYGTDVWVVPFE